ncbi:MAG: HPr family phosphocarrier protein [Planctomycetota bacterium]|nr:MAG: HPr family phosphocarrier protein [Planctomycetota bacterium]
MHARPATVFAQRANQHKADVRVRKQSQSAAVNGKSVMELLMLAATQGSTLVIEAEGEDAEEAVQSLVELVREGFGTEERAPAS